jgi:L-lactate dehydrogenase complex protein LldE
VRDLGIAKPSEIMGAPFDKTEALLSRVKGLVLVTLDRPDECCGFGGTFCVTDETVSARMGFDKIQDQLRHGAECVVSPDIKLARMLLDSSREPSARIRITTIRTI